MYLLINAGKITIGYDFTLVTGRVGCMLEIGWKYSFPQRPVNEWTNLSADWVHSSSGTTMFKNTTETYIVRGGYTYRQDIHEDSYTRTPDKPMYAAI